MCPSAVPEQPCWKINIEDICFVCACVPFWINTFLCHVFIINCGRGVRFTIDKYFVEFVLWNWVFGVFEGLLVVVVKGWMVYVGRSGGWWRVCPGGVGMYVCSRQSIMLLLHHQLPFLPGGGASNSWTIDLLVVFKNKHHADYESFQCNGKALPIRRGKWKTKKGKSKSRKKNGSCWGGTHLTSSSGGCCSL